MMLRSCSILLRLDLPRIFLTTYGWQQKMKDREWGYMWIEQAKRWKHPAATRKCPFLGKKIRRIIKSGSAFCIKPSINVDSNESFPSLAGDVGILIAMFGLFHARLVSRIVAKCLRDSINSPRPRWTGSLDYGVGNTRYVHDIGLWICIKTDLSWKLNYVTSNKPCRKYRVRCLTIEDQNTKEPTGLGERLGVILSAVTPT